MSPKSRLQSSLLFQTGNFSAEPFILTGPVIGMVTANSARILIETNLSCTVTCTLKSEGDTQQETIDLNKRVPKCFQFSDLQPETYYTVSMSIPAPGLVSSGFMTMVENWSLLSVPARFGFVAGNNAYFSRDILKENDNLWKDLFKKAYKGEIDYLIHLGNNVCIDDGSKVGLPDDNNTNKRSASNKNYSASASSSSSERGGDAGAVPNVNRWKQAQTLIEGLHPSQWDEVFEDVCELFRGAYRETWAQPMTKQTLANVPNLMILNDREICQGFGQSESHSDPCSPEFFLACCAYEVYNQYQRNLFEEYEPSKSAYTCATEVGQAYHFHVMGDIGIMMLDVRAARTLHRQNCSHPEKDASLPLLGHREWRDIEFSLSDTGYFSGCRLLFVAVPTAPAFVGESGGINVCSGSTRSPSGQWFGQEHSAEAAYFLAALFDWRAKNPGHREVSIVAGGMGYGCSTDIVDSRYTGVGDLRIDRMKQIVLAPICDSPTGDAAKVAFRAAAGIANLQPYHQFKHFAKIDDTHQFLLVDVFLDYDDSKPELGVQTRYTAKVHVRNQSLKPIESTYRQRGNFAKGLAVCNTANTNRDRVDWDRIEAGEVESVNYELRSQTSTSASSRSSSFTSSADDYNASSYTGSTSSSSVFSRSGQPADIRSRDNRNKAKKANRCACGGTSNNRNDINSSSSSSSAYTNSIDDTNTVSTYSRTSSYTTNTYASSSMYSGGVGGSSSSAAAAAHHHHRHHHQQPPPPQHAIRA